MKIAFDSFLCWILLRSVETYYGDSLKDLSNDNLNDHKDNFDIVTLKGVKQSLKVVVKALQILLKKKVPIRNNLGEPHLSNNQYYKKLNSSLILRKNILDFLLLCDGRRDLQSISKILKISERNANSTYRLLIKMNLIR